MRILVTGAAGFIGGVACRRFRAEGWEVVGLDNLSSQGAFYFPDEVGGEFYVADVRGIEELPIKRCDTVLHLAAQTAVTRSVDAPLADFLSNAEGTLRLCLWAQHHGSRLLYASTNKVFGELLDCTTPIRRTRGIDPRTPYGVSKATAGLYVREILGDLGIVFHQSCIYGPTQRGSVDQGWVAHVSRQIRTGQPVVCFGDGSQVRDLLHVDDLVDLYVQALISGCMPWGTDYVVGGGAENAYTFCEVVALLGGRVAEYQDWRPHDQRYFVSANEYLGRGWPSVKFTTAVEEELRHA